MRLDRYLSQATALSRSQVQKAVRQGRVWVNGEPARLASMDVMAGAEVLLDATPVAQPGHRYFMLNKPQGYICATTDRQHITVLDLLKEENVSGLHVVGRLDIDTTGLVLITDDGAWSHRITAPRAHCPKTYRVSLAEPLTSEQAERLKSGVVLKDSPKPTSPAGLKQISPTEIHLILTEGRYHQVKRMLAAVGNRVSALHRDSIGDLSLDSKLGAGEYRPLTLHELEQPFSSTRI